MLHPRMFPPGQQSGQITVAERPLGDFADFFFDFGNVRGGGEQIPVEALVLRHQSAYQKVPPALPAYRGFYPQRIHAGSVR